MRIPHILEHVATYDTTLNRKHRHADCPVVVGGIRLSRRLKAFSNFSMFSTLSPIPLAFYIKLVP